MVSLGSIFKANGHIIGSDKIGHFTGIGWEYYKKSVLEGEGDLSAIKYGEGTEKGLFGKRTTGVYSYGDLAANYKGMIFWKNLLYGSNPYIECKNNKWAQRRKFDWRDHIDHGMDEGINCNIWADKIKKTVTKNLKTLEIIELLRKNKAEYSPGCPVKEELCKPMVKKYIRLYGKTVAKRIISPRCYKMGIKSLWGRGR